MIYNFVAWLRSNFAAETFFINERKEVGGVVIPDRCVTVIENPGAETAWMLQGFTMVQIIARDVDSPKARKLAWDIFEYVTSRWGQNLPAQTIDGTVYPEIQTGQMTAIARPGSLGEDEEGRTEFSTNFQIYWRRT